MRELALIGLALVGCATQSVDDGPRQVPHSVPVAGGPADFRTRPGRFEGYDVVQCWDRSCGGIVGTGRNWPPGMARGPEYSDAAYQKSFQRFRAELTAALKPGVSSIDSSGLSRKCGAEGAETVFWLHNWRELDSALASAGQFLKTRDLKDRISFCVMAYSPGVDD